MDILLFCHRHHLRSIFQSETQALKMIIPGQPSRIIRLQQTTIRPYQILRQMHPGSFGIIILRQRCPKFLISKVLMVMELQFFVHIDIIRHIHITKLHPNPVPLLFLLAVDYMNIRLASGNRIIISVKWNRIRHLALQIHLHHPVRFPVVDINRTFMNLPKRLTFIHLRDRFSGFLIQQRVFVLINISHGEIARRILAACPCKPTVLASHFLHLHQYRNRLSEIREAGNVIQRQREFCCRRTDMCQFDQQVIRINHRMFTALIKKPSRLQTDILIHRKVIQDQIVGTAFLTSPRTPGLLPERRTGSRITDQYRHSDRTDINSQLQCIRTHQPQQIPTDHLLFDGLSLDRRITAPVTGNLIRSHCSKKIRRIQPVSCLF